MAVGVKVVARPGSFAQQTYLPAIAEGLGVTFRHYLLRIAEQELDPDLRAKGGASDLVQLTFLEAQRDFARFHGDTAAELRAWLRRLAWPR